jgi:hypothetical protein
MLADADLRGAVAAGPRSCPPTGCFNPRPICATMIAWTAHGCCAQLRRIDDEATLMFTRLVR